MTSEEESDEETLHSVEEGIEEKGRRNKRGKNQESKTEEEVEVDSDAIAGRSIEETEDGDTQPLSSLPPHLSPFGLTAQRRPSIVTSTMDDLSKIPLGYLWPELDGRS